MFDIIMGALAIMGVLAWLLAISIIYFTREDKPNTKNKARP